MMSHEGLKKKTILITVQIIHKPNRNVLMMPQEGLKILIITLKTSHQRPYDVSRRPEKNNNNYC